MLHTLSTLLLTAALAATQAQKTETPADLFTHDARAPLAIQVLSQEEREGARLTRLTYASPRGGPVPAVLVEPVRKGPRAGLVFVHWQAGNKLEFLDEAVALARAGAASVVLDAPFARPEPWRKRFGMGEQDREVLVQSVVDVRRAVDLLLTRAKVDPQRLAVVGHSFGATVAAIASGVEPRFKAAVLMAGLPNMGRHLQTSPHPFFAQARERMGAEYLERYVQGLAPVEPDQYVARPGPSRFFQFARRDESVPREAAEHFFQGAAEPKLFRFYDAAHELNDAARRDRAQWLRLQLGLDAPGVPQTAMIDSLERLPEPARNLFGAQMGRLRMVQPVPGMEHPRVKRDVTYAREGQRDWKLDVYTFDDPRMPARAPAVVLVHGLLHPALAEHAKELAPFRSMAERLSTEGFAVVVPSLGSPAAGPAPEQWFGNLDQVAGRVDRVLAHIREHAAELGIDKERVCVMAFSAGVPYGLRSALKGSPEYVRCAVAYYGPLTNEGLPPGTPLRDEVSALAYLQQEKAKLPPMLVVRAGLDRPELNGTIDTFMKEAKARNAPVTLLELADGHHGFEVLDDYDSSRAALRDTVSFLGQHLSR